MENNIHDYSILPRFYFFTDDDLSWVANVQKFYYCASNLEYLFRILAAGANRLRKAKNSLRVFGKL